MNNNTILAMDFEHKDKKKNVSSVGIVSGSFAPFHLGHMQLVDYSSYNYDITIVIVSGYEHDRGYDYDMPLKMRYQRLREEFVDRDDIYVAMLDEKYDKPFDDPKGLKDYKESVLEIINAYCTMNIDCKIYNIVGNKEYVHVLVDAYPDWETVCLLREQSQYPDLCATDCRTNPMKYWYYIADSFKCFFRHMVVFEGAMSTGKTTLTKQFAKLFNGYCSRGAEAVEEQARFYTEGWRHTIESDLNERDYLAFIEDHLTAMEEALMGKGNYRFVFVDTDAFATLVYLKMNKEKVSPKYKEALETVCGIAIDWCVEHVDKYIVLPNDVPFEMDGSRDGHMEDCREEFRDMVISEIRNRVPEDKIYLVQPNNIIDKTHAIINVVFNL